MLEGLKGKKVAAGMTGAGCPWPSRWSPDGVGGCWFGVMALLAEVHGTAIQLEMVPSVQDCLFCGLKTRFGIERMNALPALLFSDEALMQLAGFNAQHVCQVVCQRGAAKRSGKRTPELISPETSANNIVKLNLQGLKCVFNGAILALARAGVFSKQVTGIAGDLATAVIALGGLQIGGIENAGHLDWKDPTHTRASHSQKVAGCVVVMPRLGGMCG